MDSQYKVCKTSEEDGYISPKRTNINKLLFRWFGQFLICFLGFGVYFCYDNPGALQDKFEINMIMPASNFVLLYSVYSWPNVILCFVGGFLLDRVFGIRWGTIIYALLTLCGQLLFALGTYANIFWLMVLGRFIFGSGAESLMVAQSSYGVLWSNGKALNMLFGLQLTFSRIGATSNSLSSESIYRAISTLNYTESQCVGIVLFIAAIPCIGSMFCTFLLAYMDRHRQTKEFTKKNKEKEPELVKLTDVKDFGRTFWLLVLVAAAYYIAVLSFASLGKLFFMTKYKFEPDQANKALSLMHSVSAIFAPVFGFMVDRTGKNIIWIIGGIVGLSFAHGLLAFTYVSPYICMVLFGMSYSTIASSFWPIIAHVVPEHQLGTAYGVTQAFQNLNLAIMSIVCGWIVDNYGYFELELLFLTWLAISLVPAIIIWTTYSKSADET